MATSADDGLPVLAARAVNKTFQVPEQQVHTLKERVLHPFRRISRRDYHVLNDISFAVGRGEFFGIAGRNGSGKSTLLKCMAGIYSFDGDIWRRGRISTFIELGVGFNPDLAARDNVITNGIMMGLTPREARRRYDSVIDFAELQEFQDLKLKNYSSGMHVRLAFSVAIQVDADILLVDEILAVGDAAFQQKCFDVFNRLRDEGKTLVLVTHSMSELNRFCDRALLLERGSMVTMGDPREVGDRYLELNFGREPVAAEPAPLRGGDGEARVISSWIEDERGERQAAVAQGRRITLRAEVTFVVDVEDPQASVTLLADDHRPILVASTALGQERSGRFVSGETATFSFSFENILAPGRYSPVFNLYHRGSGVDVIDHFESSASFVVTGAHALGGVVDVPVQVGIERTDPVTAQRLPA
jgi:ABC-type polysaccharide/polyol phosphate transport system ATPase subunit